jgi:hypothetical protein
MVSERDLRSRAVAATQHSVDMWKTTAEAACGRFRNSGTAAFRSEWSHYR